MKLSGFDFAPSEYGQPDLYYGTYGLTNADQARTHGYLQPGLEDAPDLMAIELAKFPSDPDEKSKFTLALNGDETLPNVIKVDNSALAGVPDFINFPRGCLGTADLKLFGSVETYARYQTLSNWLQLTLQAAIEATFASDVAIHAAADWAACMSSSGYTYESIFEPFGQEWDEPRPGTTEIDTAVADVACKEEVEYVAQLRSIERALQSDAINGNPTALQEFEKLRAEVLANAAVALGNRG